MSFTLSTIKNPYLSLTKDKLINLNTGGVEDISLQLNLNAPHTLDLTINPNLGNLYYEFLENANLGIYLSQDDGLNLTFIKKPQDTKSEQSVFSKAKISFLSTVSLLKNTRVYPRQMPIGSVFTGTTDIYFSSISDKIHISFISKPLNEKISTNVGDCWDLFTDGIDKLGGY